MSETSTDVVWLTQEAYDKLEAELNNLKLVGRPDVTARIASAREEGDLSENGGYHAAREEQAKQEARINQLTTLLRDAEVGEAPADDGVVEAGMVVTATIAGKDKRFLLGSREAAKGVEIDVFSESSPLGQALMGKKKGEKTSYLAPNGSTIEVDIKDAVPFTG